MKEVANIASAIVFVALMGVLVKSPNTAKILQAIGQVFSGSLRIAEGR